MNDYGNLKRVTSMARKANEERQRAHDKETLKRHISTKLKTTMIGALSSFEDNFGHLWGHGEEEYTLSDEQLRLRDLWELVRTDVLNKGNNQSRAAMTEIDQYDVKYIKQKYDFTIKPGRTGDTK